MTDIILENICLIIFLPFWIFLILMLGRFFSVYVNKTITQILTLLSSAIGTLVTLGLYKFFTPDKIYENTYPFIKINDFIISFGIQIDRLSLIFASLLFLISFLIQIFCITYMKDEKKQYRFYALINLFNFSLAGLFFSPNLFQMYVFWELAGIISYLLIGFEYNKLEKSNASKKVFIINRIGDTALLGGIIICSYLLYEYAPTKHLAELSFYDMNTISMLIGAYTSKFLFLTICGLFVLASVVKSAQLPFYIWLQEAMEAKLPVSALLHSATLVGLGVFLLIRITPMFMFSPMILKTIALIGILTATVCSLSACAQINPKKTLAYSTSAQHGLILFAIGVLSIKAAIAIFCAHAVTKSMLFITLPKDNEKWNYTKFVLFLTGGLSLSGILLSGMISKEMFAFTLGTTGKYVIAILSFLTAFYIIRIALIIADKNGLDKIKPELPEIISPLGLICANILLYVYLRKHGEYQIAELLWTALTAWGIMVYILYKKQKFFKIPYLYSICFNGFYADKLLIPVFVHPYNKLTELLNKFDTSVLGNYKPIVYITKLGVKILSWIEINIMNKTVSYIADFTRRLSAISKQLQTKNVQWYNFYGFIIITAVISCLVIAYAAILAYIRGVV